MIELGLVYDKVKEFKHKYPKTIAWRVKRHAKVVESFLNPDEIVSFAFAAQKNNSNFNFFDTCVIAVTNQRLLIGQKRVTWGYSYGSITPDLYNDLKVEMRVIYGAIIIDTVKEVVFLSNIQKEGLDDVETAITSFMMKEKRKMRIERNSK